ncbi:MAG: hypothetical protein HQM11_10385 [SAR324 cluster bacterium]|nr:hypothetical protein [SAR324 cluster bacterium]
MFGSKKSVRHQQAVIDLALKQIRKMLEEMQGDGKDLTRLKLKRFQKTHHISCRCPQCREAKSKEDPRLRGMLEDGFKVYIEGESKEE